tara:strand:+ start:367 stop:1011 length:645 start_codon:yes stop_codon:yes gene_type:complete
MSKLDITFSPEFYDRIAIAHEQIQVDNANQSEGNKQYVLNLLNDDHSGVNLLLACYSEAFDMKEARGGKQLSGKDLIELGLSSSDKEEAKGLRKMRDGCAKLYDAKNEGTKEMFIAWVEEHDSFAYATIWDAIRACFRKDTVAKANPKPTDLKAFAIKVMEGIANRKFDNDEQFDTKELEEIAILIGLEVMPKEVFKVAKQMQAKENQKKKKVA